MDSEPCLKRATPHPRGYWNPPGGEGRGRGLWHSRRSGALAALATAPPRPLRTSWPPDGEPAKKSSFLGKLSEEAWGGGAAADDRP